ncbi:hypothetical protein SCHPADRAFT_201021 [Schizopora paradoxa]|uniref:Uncharacterized protein n=1 Tax=Schizopora paradoxa TaxID=27342 RepID=A0A0H2RYU2_9AGAM|nr:hypothetical protein SCHPADRAFT_201021 [Schizopora paradoxa]
MRSRLNTGTPSFDAPDEVRRARRPTFLETESRSRDVGIRFDNRDGGRKCAKQAQLQVRVRLRLKVGVGVTAYYRQAILVAWNPEQTCHCIDTIDISSTNARLPAGRTRRSRPNWTDGRMGAGVTSNSTSSAQPQNLTEGAFRSVGCDYIIFLSSPPVLSCQRSHRSRHRHRTEHGISQPHLRTRSTTPSVRLSVFPI